MTKKMLCIMLAALTVLSCTKKEQQKVAVTNVDSKNNKKLFLDIHNLEPGKVTAADVASAHQKDLAVQNKHDVNFIKYWVDEVGGKVYCLSESPDQNHIRETHREAHGLLPDVILSVSDGPEAALTGRQLFLDVHELGAGNVTAQAVAEAHEKDLAVQEKYGVRFINYWVNESNGTVVCLSEAPNDSSVVHTHKEAHGLIPARIAKVTQGN